MKRFFILILLYSTSLFSHAALQSSIKNGIEHIISQFNLPATIGIQIQAMDNGKILYQKNPQQLFVPASNLKLFTAVASLLYLKPDYQFQTTLLTDAKTITNGTLQGNVYLKFSGDPSLTAQQVQTLLSNLNKNNIKAISGNFYIDQTSYNNKPYGPGWMWDELNVCYAAPLEATMIDQNCINATLTPAANIGEAAQLNLTTHFISVDNQVKTVDANSNCPLELKANNRNHYILSGCLLTQTPPMNLQIAIKNPNLYAKNFIASTLQNYGIQFTGKILNKKANDDLIVIARQNSQPLSSIVNEMMKQSNDPIANSLFMKLGENYSHDPATWKEATTALQNILTQEAKLNLTNASIVDGAGISRYNLVSPQQISQLLYFAYHNAAIAPFLMTSLPIAGKDGTLQDRMTAMDIQGKVKAKTGSMTGISALSGYVSTAQHKTLAFVILINNFNKTDAHNAELLEDKISEYLVSS